MKTKNDVEGLIKVLKYKKDFKVRAEAAWVLGKIGDGSAVEPLIHALKDKHWSVRWRSPIALGEIGNPIAINSLIQALKDKHWTVRKKAAIALRNLGEPAVEHLIRALKDKNR
ncbi:MAG: HEAT repeat domain-containing protein, partial [Candidatus Wukongarchaeota archaeon]|nr:HEAT repeat domain-containing protein [Candidatus Wukongarchaeota archaeon]